MKKIYLDVCTLCRPFDNQDFARINLETGAVNLILSGVKENKYILMKSVVHNKEIQAITDDFERNELFRLLDNYGKSIKIETGIVKKRTEELILKKFGIADAAHVAFAEYYKSIFITCDDKLLNKCFKTDLTLQCMNPVAFCEKENLK
ncbi:MAG TPA: hypothetical protein PK514_15050 [Spirochaetota bacterium]|nr:hypothetical protein [Spirochaetota bacterium]